MKHSTFSIKMISGLLIPSFLCSMHGCMTWAAEAPAAASTAAPMITTTQFLEGTASQRERNRILSLLQQDQVRQKLQEYGISEAEAVSRINGLTDAEVATLAQRLDQIPAGQDAAGAILGTALAVFLILLITDILCLTKVFPFTRCAGSHK